MAGSEQEQLQIVVCLMCLLCLMNVVCREVVSREFYEAEVGVGEKCSFEGHSYGHFFLSSIQIANHPVKN